MRRASLERLPEPLVGLIGAFLRRDWRTVESHRALLNNPRTLVELERNHIAGIFYVWLKMADRQGLLLPDNLQRTRKYYVKQWLRSERLLVETEDLLVEFGRWREPVILLKGPYLAKRFYGGIEHRAIEDVDLLVRAGSFRKSLSIAKACGYERRSWMPYGPDVARRFVHGLSFSRDGYPLDLHHAIRVHPALRVDYDKLWSRCRSFEVRGQTCHVPSDEDALLVQLLSMHADMGRAAVRVRQFIDLLVMIRDLEEGFDWEEFLAERRQDGTYRLSIAIIALCLALFEHPAGHPQLRSVLARGVRDLSVPASPEGCVRFLVDTGRLKLVFWWARLLEWPTAATMAWWTLGFPVRYASQPSNLLPRLAMGLRRRRPA